MVNKGRLAGFIDAIVAVVMTIMLLEFRLPKNGSVVAFFQQNLVYLIAYLLSFIYVTTSWYNQQYMMHHAERVTRRIYVACMLWVLSLSLLPILSAWAGRTMDIFRRFGADAPKAPALSFLVMISLWGLAYVHMTKAFIADNPGEKAEIIRQMEVQDMLSSRLWQLGIALSLIVTYFYPPFVFIWTAGEMIVAMIRSRNARER